MPENERKKGRQLRVRGPVVRFEASQEQRQSVERRRKGGVLAKRRGVLEALLRGVRENPKLQAGWGSWCLAAVPGIGACEGWGMHAGSRWWRVDDDDWDFGGSGGTVKLVLAVMVEHSLTWERYLNDTQAKNPYMCPTETAFIQAYRFQEPTSSVNPQSLESFIVS